MGLHGLNGQVRKGLHGFAWLTGMATGGDFMVLLDFTGTFFSFHAWVGW